MLSGPETTRILHQFEEQYLTDTEESSKDLNHEMGQSAQNAFRQEVNNLVDVIKKMGNPFLDDFPELVKLDSRDCMDDVVATAIFDHETLGKSQYQNYVKAVIEDRTTPIDSPIKKNKLARFGKQHSHTKSKQAKTITALQNNVALFAQLYIAMQSRNADLLEFFSHEVQPFPPSLSDFGKILLPSMKSELLKCIVHPEQPSDVPTSFDCKIFDGAVVIHCLPVTGVTTFNDYAENVFIPYISSQTSARIDVVWDTYIENSLKESTREKRGARIRRKVSGETKLPSNWMQFLRDSTNKKELFEFLTSKVAKFNWEEKMVYINSGISVISIGTDNSMPDCNHEEADTRIVVHLIHALLNDQTTSVLVRTVDTDVIIILVGKFHFLKSIKPDLKLWVAFGTGRNFSLISINRICHDLGEERSRSLPVFHALSGCDTTSSFRGKGKKSAWQAWQLFPDITATFLYLESHPFTNLEVDSDHFLQIERFTIILYDKLSPETSINKARMEFFCKNNKAMEKLPPTQDALLQHVRRSAYQAGIWTTSGQTLQEIPSPEQFSWSKEATNWVPKWITIPEVSKTCSELIKCNCKGVCTRCKCAKASLKCTPLCKCNCT